MNNFTLFINIINTILIVFITYKYIINKYLLLIPIFISLFCFIAIPIKSFQLAISLTIIFLAAIFLFRYYDNMKYLRRIIPIGIMIGILVIFRIEMAVFIYGMYFWAIFWAGLADVEGLRFPLKKRAVRSFFQGIFFTFTVIIVIVLYMCYELIYKYKSFLFSKLIVELKNMFSVTGLFKIPTFNDNIILLTLLSIYIISLIILIFKHKKKILLSSHPCFWKEMLIINIGLNLYPQAILTSDIENTIPLILISSMLLPNIIYYIINEVKIYKDKLLYDKINNFN